MVTMIVVMVQTKETALLAGKISLLVKMITVQVHSMFVMAKMIVEMVQMNLPIVLVQRVRNSHVTMDHVSVTGSFFLCIIEMDWCLTYIFEYIV